MRGEKRKGPTLGWVDKDAGSIEAFLGGPVLIPNQCPNGEEQEQPDEDDMKDPFPQHGVRLGLEKMEAQSEEEAKPHRRDVEDPLRHDESHVEEEIRGRDEGEEEQGQAHHRYVQAIPGESMGHHEGCMYHSGRTVPLASFGFLFLPPLEGVENPPAPIEEEQVEEGGQPGPDVPGRTHRRDGVHAPVEAQHRGHEEEKEVEHG